MYISNIIPNDYVLVDIWDTVGVSLMSEVRKHYSITRTFFLFMNSSGKVIFGRVSDFGLSLIDFDSVDVLTDFLKDNLKYKDANEDDDN